MLNGKVRNDLKAKYSAHTADGFSIFFMNDMYREKMASVHASQNIFFMNVIHVSDNSCYRGGAGVIGGCRRTVRVGSSCAS